MIAAKPALFGSAFFISSPARFLELDSRAVPASDIVD
jgi:hypothetical protein